MRLPEYPNLPAGVPEAGQKTAHSAKFPNHLCPWGHPSQELQLERYTANKKVEPVRAVVDVTAVILSKKITKSTFANVQAVWSTLGQQWY